MIGNVFMCCRNFNRLGEEIVVYGDCGLHESEYRFLKWNYDLNKAKHVFAENTLHYVYITLKLAHLILLQPYEN